MILLMITVFLFCTAKCLAIPEGTSSNVNQQEYLEELYIKETVLLLNDMSTLDEKEVTFDDNDIRLLTKECDTDENCLNDKKEPVKKYHQKMQAIQCIHGLFVLKVLDELKTIVFDNFFSTNIRKLRYLLRNKDYLTSTLALLKMANWDPYAWQIEMFTFVEGLVATDANFKLYEDHHENHHERIRKDVLAFISKCVHHKYLMYQSNTTSEDLTISHLTDRVYSQMEWYQTSPLLVINRQLGLYCVRNLILWPLYTHYDFIVDWSMFKQIKLETAVIIDQLENYIASYAPIQLKHIWELDPIGLNKFNALFAKCIHLRLVYHVWYHLHIYHTLQSRPMDENAQQFWSKTILFQMWYALVVPLKTALRKFRFNENIYWSAIRVMMNDFNKISKEELAAREEYTRNYFCQAVVDLKLASASDIKGQLKKITIAEDYDSVYKEIEGNAKSLNDYTLAILDALSPIDGSFVRIIVSAEGNETFVMH